MNIELLNLMADCRPKSCAEIQRKLNLSPSQLLDACHRLKTLGVNIEHQADNLCLIPILPLLDIEALRQALPSLSNSNGLHYRKGRSVWLNFKPPVAVVAAINGSPLLAANLFLVFTGP